MFKLNVTAKISASIAKLHAPTVIHLNHLCFCVQIPKFTNCLLRQRHSPFGPSLIALQHATYIIIICTLHLRHIAYRPNRRFILREYVWPHVHRCTYIHAAYLDRAQCDWVFSGLDWSGRGRLVSTMGKTKMKLLRTLMEYIISSARETDFLKQRGSMFVRC